MNVYVSARTKRDKAAARPCISEDKSPLSCALTITGAGQAPATVSVTTLILPQYQYLFVASIIGIVPVVILFALMERHIVSGLTAGSIR